MSSQKQMTLHFDIRHVPGDGNCQYYCIQHFLDDDKSIEDIRYETYNRLKTFKSKYSPFLKDHLNYNDFIEKILDDGTWGDNFTLAAMCDNYGLTAHVYHEDQGTINKDRFYTDNTPIIVGSKVNTLNIYLLYDNVHYDVLIQGENERSRDPRYDRDEFWVTNGDSQDDNEDKKVNWGDSDSEMDFSEPPIFT